MRTTDGPVTEAVSGQKPVVINDTGHESRFSPAYFDPYTKSELILPLINGNQFLGVLDLCSDGVNTFGPNELINFLSLSENIAVAVRNAKLYRSEQLRRQTNEHLQDVIGRISADTSYDDVLNKILIELNIELHSDASAIWLFDNLTSDDGMGQFTSCLRLAAVNVKDHSDLEEAQNQILNINETKEKLLLVEDESTNLLTDYPWISEILNSKQPLIRNSSSPTEPLGCVLSFMREYSAIGLSLYNADQLLGVIISVHRLPDQYAEETLVIASTFANYVSIAIENTRLFTAAHDQVWMSTVQQQVAEATQSINSLVELLQTITGMLIDLVGVNACTLYIWDQSMEAFFPQASTGFDEMQQARLNSWDIFSGSVSAFDQLVQTSRPVILNSDSLSDELASLIFPTYDLQRDLLVLFPMIAQKNLLGSMLIDFTHTELGKNSSQRLWDEMYNLIQGISNQVASAIEKLQTIKSREEEAYISVALLQVAQAIVSLNQLDEILASIVRITPILVGVKRCIIYLWDNKEKVFRPTQYFGFSKNELQFEGQVIRPNEFPLLKTIITRNQVAYHQLVPDSSPSSWHEIESSDLHIIEGIILEGEEQSTIKLDDEALRDKARLLIGFPLSVKGEVLGVMLIEEEDPVKGSPSYHIREKRVEIVKGITQQAALAIKNEQLQEEAVNSERMERELQLAREIQRTFLPDHLPTLPGWDMDIRWQPARQVAGDFYDILVLDQNRLGFVIADVADKGMPAALYMTLIRTLIRAAAKDIYSPASVLKQVNELLVPDIKNGMFVTVFYAVIDLDTGKIIYANAGHNPPIIKYSQSDELVELTRTSIALGIFDDIEVDEREVSLNPGDWILLYTDGLTEAFSDNEEMFGTKRLFDLLQSNQYTSSKAILDMIVEAVQDFIKGADLSDDLTLAVIINKLS